jgi:phage gpG-like protein
MDIQVTVRNADIMKVELQAISQRLEKLDRSVMEQIGEAVVQVMRERTSEGLDVTGSPFAPLSPVTLARRSGGGPPLTSTGALVRSINVLDATDRTVKVGVSGGRAGVKARFLQQGGYHSKESAYPGTAMPARQFVGLGPREEEALSKRLLELVLPESEEQQ